MEAGRDLDQLIHEKVMGLPLEVVAKDHPYFVDGTPMRVIAKSYSTSIAAAWEVVEELAKGHWSSAHTDLTIDSKTPWWSWHFSTVYPQPLKEVVVTAQAKTAPLAICLAALKAIEENQA